MKRSTILFALALLAILVAGCMQPNSPGPSTTVPSAPTGVSASAVTTGDGQVSISWSSASGATSYNLYWAAASTVTKATGTKVAGVTSPVVVNNIPQGTPYSFVVTAANTAGESAASSVANSTLPTTTNHIYLTGEVGGYPVYWKDGVVHQLGSASVLSGGHIAVTPSDGIYAAVYDFRGTTKAAAYWNNGTLVSLSVPAGTTLDFFGGIGISGTDVYIAATVKDGSGAQLPVMWKNGTLTSLPLGTDTQGYAGQVVVSGTDVYMAGTTSTPDGSGGTSDGNVVYWKNGVLTVLNQGAGNGYGWSEGDKPGTGGILLSGTDIYIYGTTYTSQGGEPIVWKNGGAPGVSNATGTNVNFSGFALAFSGGIFYGAGDREPQSSNTSGIPVYFDNSGGVTLLPLPAAVTVGSADFISVVGADIYILGYQATSFLRGSASTLPLFWKNGTLTTLALPSGDPNVYFTGMDVSGSDLYIVGTTGTWNASQNNVDFNSSHPVYWKNRNMNILPLETYSAGYINGMLISPN